MTWIDQTTTIIVIEKKTTHWSSTHCVAVKLEKKPKRDEESEWREKRDLFDRVAGMAKCWWIICQFPLDQTLGHTKRCLSKRLQSNASSTPSLSVASQPQCVPVVVSASRPAGRLKSLEDSVWPPSYAGSATSPCIGPVKKRNFHCLFFHDTLHVWKNYNFVFLFSQHCVSLPRKTLNFLIRRSFPTSGRNLLRARPLSHGAPG